VNRPRSFLAKHDLDSGIVNEIVDANTLGTLMMDRDFREALEALRDKRPPRFS
jgi:hypothetical protein